MGVGSLIGFEMGPGLLRRAPRGWVPARATAVECRVRSHHYGSADGGAPEIETTFNVKARWRIEIDGRAPYEVQEERDGPAWTAGGGVGGGNRWYKVRVRPQYGLMKDVPIPCFVNPENAGDLWIDWDGAYEAHEVAWEREGRIRRGVGDRSNLYDRAWERLANPFAGKPVTDEERAEVERRVEAERPLPAPTDIPPSPFQLRMEDLKRIKETGRKTRGTVMRHEPTNREMWGSPIVVLRFHVEGREILFEHCYGPRHLKHYKIGREVELWIDPENPAAICPGR